MKKKEIVIGIDVSKDKLDVFVHSINYHFIVNNASDGFAKLLEICCEKGNCRVKDLFFCFENTGKYSKMLSVFFYSQNITFLMESALMIKKSLGLTRGKNDRVDAQRIAKYAFEKMDSIIPTKLPDSKIDKMKAFLSLREKLVKTRTAYKNGLTGLNDCYEHGENSLIKKIQQRIIIDLDKEIELIENEIMKIIKSNEKMNQNYKLILSIIGMGKINAFYFIAITANFSLFKTWRSYACYAGIAPFPNSSGKMIGKSKVHHYANKQVKTMLNMAARSAVSSKGELNLYFNKRTKEGKNKMSTLNIIRNKLVARVFAVVKRGTPFIDITRFAA